MLEDNSFYWNISRGSNLKNEKHVPVLQKESFDSLNQLKILKKVNYRNRSKSTCNSTKNNKLYRCEMTYKKKYDTMWCSQTINKMKDRRKDLKYSFEKTINFTSHLQNKKKKMFFFKKY